MPSDSSRTRWYQLLAEAPAEAVPALEALLEAAGALSVTVQDAGDQPLLEPLPGTTPLWHQVRLAALFPAGAPLADLMQRLEAAGARAVHTEPLGERDWVRAWLDDFRPMSFGRRLWVVPSGHEPPDPAAVNLHLDPGLAFGTGTHPTTAMCLRWLDAHLPAGAAVLDYGCGSGILAVAAARLGAARVTAVDIDPQALTATRANAAANGVADHVRVLAPEALVPEPVEVVLANILAGPLAELAPELAAHLAPGGHLVLSGILAEQAPAVAAAYAPWLALQEWAREKEWVCLAGRRAERGDTDRMEPAPPP